MKTFKQKSLYAALAGVSALGVTGAAQAVNVNPDGLGQVLIYPYYTARSIGPNTGAPYVSALTVVNSTASGKAVKVRFIEGKASQEVLDFNLFLSAKDVWTAGVLATTTGGGAGVGTFDTSCTVPALPANGGLQPFVNYLYFNDAVGDASLDRTMEGYVEIIEMGTIIDGTDTYKATVHTAGVATCDPDTLVPSTANDPTDPVNVAIGLDLTSPSGGLFGDMTLINVLAGTDYTEDAVALDNFRNASKYDPPGSVKPDLQDVSPPISVVFDSSSSSVFAGSVVLSNFNSTQAVDSISALFMHDHVYNDYVLDSGTASGTDWVLTFPTKRYYYDTSGFVQKLFQSNLGTTGACDDITTLIYDREEQSAKGSVGFSPPKPGAKANQLCWEANVLTFNGSQALGSTNNRNLTVAYQNGWVDLAFPVESYPHSSATFHTLFNDDTTTIDLFGNTGATAATYVGLPVIGFAVQSYTNGELTDPAGALLQSNYGGAFVHKTTRFIEFGGVTADKKATAKKAKK